MKVINVLNNKYEGTLEDGFIFKIPDLCSITWMYDVEDNVIRNIDDGMTLLGNIICIENVLDYEIEEVTISNEQTDFTGTLELDTWENVCKNMGKFCEMTENNFKPVKVEPDLIDTIPKFSSNVVLENKLNEVIGKVNELLKKEV